MFTLNNLLDALLFLTTTTVAYFFASRLGLWGVLPSLIFASLAIWATIYLEDKYE